MLNYILQISICWAAFYLVYLFFLKKETFFNLNRTYLLTTLMLSMAIPYVSLPIFATESLTMAQVNPVDIEFFLAEAPVIEASSNSDHNFSWHSILWLVYAATTFGMLCKFLLSIAQIRNLYTSGNKLKKQNYFLIENDLLHMPFSFLNYLFFSKKMTLSSEEKQQIIQHEETHIKQWHSIDVLIIELFQIIFWFNPIIFLYKRSIKENHEYLADQAVLQHTSKKKYGRLLLGQSDPGIQIALANNFNYSQLKNRIIMMTRQQSSNKARYKFLLAVPVLLMATILFANRQSLSTPHETSSITEVITDKDFDEKEVRQQILHTLYNMKVARIQAKKSGKNRDSKTALRFNKRYEELIANHPNHIEKIQAISKELADRYDFELEFEGQKIKTGYFKKSIETVIAELAIDNKETFRIVEEMPTFGTCDDGTISKDCSDTNILKFIQENLKYPDLARKNGKQGMAVVSFIINNDGSIRDAIVMRNPGDGTGEEALRVLNKMPKWNPGKQRGETVSVQFNLPIKFKLSSNDEEAPPAPPVAPEAPPAPPIAPEAPPAPPVAPEAPPAPPIAPDAPPAPPVAPPPPPYTRELAEMQKSNKADFFKVVEEMPYWKSCETAASPNARKICSDTEILKFIQENLRYPREARKQGVQGMAVVSFIIEKDGSLSNIRAVRDPGSTLGEEARRVIATMPKWNPGKQRGKTVRVQYNMPIRFKLQNNTKPKSSPAPKPSKSTLLPLGDFKLAPNPSNGLIRVSFTTPSQADLNLNIVDLTGKTIWSSTESSFSGRLNKEINIDAPVGSYYMVIRQAGKMVSKAFIIIQ